MKKNIGIYLGRFQPLHRGHVSMIFRMMLVNDVSYLFIAGNNNRSSKNPFPFWLRKLVFLSCLPKTSKLKIIKTDHGYLPSLIKEHVPCSNSVLSIFTGGDRNGSFLQQFSMFEEQDTEIRFVNQEKRIDNVSATKVRDSITNKEKTLFMYYMPIGLLRIEKMILYYLYRFYLKHN